MSPCRNRVRRIAPGWMIAVTTVIGVIVGSGVGALAAGPNDKNPYDGPDLKIAENPIDKAVFEQLKRLNITPAKDCTDGTFLRRAYLDLCGTLPTLEEAKAFLADARPDKRSLLVDQLLERNEYAEYWALRWADLFRIKSEFPINLWPNAVHAYHRWIRMSLQDNKPYDKFVREMLTASGSNFRVGPVNFYRAVQSKEPSSLAQVVALTFMGVRAEKWPKERLDDMSVFFSQIGYKATGEWKEEIVYYDPSKALGKSIAAVLPDGDFVDITPGTDPRKVFADWLIKPSNPYFTRNIANRMWSWLVGRGVIHEPDDIRIDNPPVNSELLAVLEKTLVDNKYDLKALFRAIMKSRAYQLSCIPRSTDPKAEANFASYPLRRIEAEVLIDAIDQITGGSERYISPIPEPYTFIPDSERAITLADASVTSSFLELFSRSNRDTGLESERIPRTTGFQRLHLLNSTHIQRKLDQSEKLRSLQTGRNRPRDVLDALYLTILSRYPTEEEVRAIADYRLGNAADRRGGLDIAWALLNTAEFQHRH